MSTRLLRNSLLAALALVAAPVAAHETVPEERPELALMGTVPIYWGEADGFEEVLAGETPGHWARAVLEREYALVPLDYLSAEALAGRDLLLMAQPRALSGEENVALDDWVRAGGRVLLLADPMMTGESRFSLGDRRRPQDVALLSPILGRWGLELMFDEEQAPGVTVREIAGQAVPVNLAGHFEPRPSEVSQCAVESDGLIASCRVGEGYATVLADAALVDVDGPLEGADTALAMLAGLAFGESGDDAGPDAPAAP